MKRAIFLSALSVSILAYPAVTMNSVQASAAQGKFYCGRSKQAPATMAKTSRGPVPVIRWVSTLGETYTPENRCKIVSEKFQTFYNNGTLNYLTTGVVNELPVICAAQHENGPCVGVLFTLKPNSDPGRTLQRLLSIRDRAPGAVLNESAPQIYVNMTDFLNTAPTETETTSADIDGTISAPNQSESTSNPNGKSIW